MPFFSRALIALFSVLFLINTPDPSLAQGAGEPIRLELDRRVDFVTRKGVRSFCAHFADDLLSRQRGLMFQTHLPEKCRNAV